MRIGGLASGMDIDKLVGDLMKVERMPLNKMEQEKTLLTWKRDAYRDVNKQLFELENMAMDMKLQRSFNSKSTSSSNSSAVTATATPNADNGNYQVNVTQMATTAYNFSESKLSATNSKIDPDASLESQEGNFKNAIEYGSFEIKTYGEDGQSTTESFEVTKDKSLNDVLSEISDSGLGVRAFYEESSDQVMIERTTEGNFNDTEFLGAEIGFNGSTAPFLANTLEIKNGEKQTDGTWKLNEKGGDDAVFTYNNGIEITAHKNEYTLNGVTFEMKSTGSATINVSNDVDSAMDKITGFIEKYNEVIENLNKQVNEQENRDYDPLTEKQKESMEEKQIEMWEEQAKKGLLHSDSTIRNALFEMRNEWYESVDTSGQFSQLSEIGIETSSNYRDGGKLIINENKLRQKLTEDPDSVSKLFTGEGNTEGIADKLKSTLNETVKSVERKAGKASSVPTTYTIGRDIVDVNSEMKAFQDRLNQIEDRYWSQFTQMEKAIQKMNSQSAQLMQMG
ncbi:flagellar hook-associated protein 2 [Pontibacillus sp. HMF3514]|uniref:flagellar hook-associated protein 2 n=1 Tax=Pontibacillus sp. HMF3514 TaxID=2692425 RepID=UPI00131FED2B|nr:flagellar hook-associated protein 2 [Pontibacillus sp. HMF3514]QHE53591.1 flagellar hook-associated protein 2 [Pontibacillus sp. HMF3514]